MAKFTIPRLVGKTNMAGLTTWYWQPSKTLRARGWAPRRLGAAHGEDPPQDVVDAARELNAKVGGGDGATPASIRRIQRVVTLGEGLRRFQDEGYPSVKYPGRFVAPATRDQYRYKFRVLEQWGGDVALASIDRDRVAVLRDALMRPAGSGPRAGEVRHHHAHETLRVGRTFFSWCEQKGLIPRGHNPFDNFGLAQPDPRQQVWWPPAREAVMAAAEAAGDRNMALAIDLAFQIGQREADLLRTGLGQYRAIAPYKMDPEIHRQLAAIEVPAYGDRAAYMPGDVNGIIVRQAKTKVWVEVPIVGLTRARVEAAIAEAKAAGLTTILRDQARGLPWTMPNLKTGQEYFSRRFGELRAAAIAAVTQDGDEALAAEIADLQYRDFRRTAVVYMGELGIADHLIAAITGHSLDQTKDILKTYMPLTTGMAARAIALSQARAPAAANQEKKA